MTVLQKIRVFSGLSLQQSEFLVRICQSRSYEPEKYVYRVGGESDEMFILIAGKLKAVSKAGQVLGDILPGQSTGEMGVFTGQPRSASIVSVEKSVGLAVGKQNLEALLKTNQEMRATVLQNVVDLLSHRLVEADKKIEELRAKIPKKG